MFSIRTDGSDFAALHRFSGPDGANFGATPFVEDGRLYGVTMSGSACSNGVVFSMRTDGSDYRVLHPFAADESGPMEGVFAMGDMLYGATSGTGANDTFGVIYLLPAKGRNGLPGPSPAVIYGRLLGKRPTAAGRQDVLWPGLPWRER